MWTNLSWLQWPGSGIEPGVALANLILFTKCSLVVLNSEKFHLSVQTWDDRYEPPYSAYRLTSYLHFQVIDFFLHVLVFRLPHPLHSTSQFEPLCDSMSIKGDYLPHQHCQIGASLPDLPLLRYTVVNIFYSNRKMSMLPLWPLFNRPGKESFGFACECLLNHVGIETWTVSRETMLMVWLVHVDLGDLSFTHSRVAYLWGDVKKKNKNERTITYHQLKLWMKTWPQNTMQWIGLKGWALISDCNNLGSCQTIGPEPLYAYGLENWSHCKLVALVYDPVYFIQQKNVAHPQTPTCCAIVVWAQGQIKLF